MHGEISDGPAPPSLYVTYTEVLSINRMKGSINKMRIVRNLTMVTMCFFGLISMVGLESAFATTGGWLVNGALLSGTAALATTAEVTENARLTVAGETVECKGKPPTL